MNCEENCSNVIRNIIFGFNYLITYMILTYKVNTRYKRTGGDAKDAQTCN